MIQIIIAIFTGVIFAKVVYDFIYSMVQRYKYKQDIKKDLDSMIEEDYFKYKKEADKIFEEMTGTNKSKMQELLKLKLEKEEQIKQVNNETLEKLRGIYGYND